MHQQGSLIGRMLAKLFRSSEKNSRVFSVGLASIALRLSGASLTLLLTVVLARVLGPSGYGVYSYAVALVTLTAVLSQLGLPTLVVRETARYQSVLQWDRMRGLFIRASQIVATTSVLGIGILLTILAIFKDLIPSSQMQAIIFALVLVPMVSFNNVGGASLRGLGFAVRGQLAEQLFRPGLFLLFLLVLIFSVSREAVTAQTVMLVHGMAAVLAFLLGATLLRKAIPQELHRAVSNFEDGSLWRRSLYPLSILAGLQIINGQTDILMLGIFADSADVGVYRVAYQGASLVNLTLFAI
jgi:O-antigen/teichoic acid export membrane protein